MIGVCSILTQDPSVDPIKYFNRAFEHYSKLRGRQGRMLATRVMMTAAAYQAALGRWGCAGGWVGGCCCRQGQSVCTPVKVFCPCLVPEAFYSCQCWNIGCKLRGCVVY
jgi:hypothetical protein